MTRIRLNRRKARLQLEYLEDRSVPATFNVNTTLDVIDPSDGKLSLREAIVQANNQAGGDVIVLPAGVFKITIPGAGGNANATGDFDITDAATIQGAGGSLTVIDGQQLDRVFDILGSGPSSIKVVLQGLTVRNGLSDAGGGIGVGNADLVVRDCVVTGNRASQSGGGIFSPGTGNVTLVRTMVGRNVSVASGGGISATGNSVLTVRDSTVRRNVADASGGGIFAAKATLTNCTISGNFAGASGGGISAITTATLKNCTISGNFAHAAGGGVNAITTATLKNCTISGNFAAVSGGGFRAATATLTNSTISDNNTGFNGGGIEITGTATLTSCTVSGNNAGIKGGGIIGNVNLTNSTVSGNTAGERGGGINANTVTLTNCTVTGNTAVIEGGGVFATTATLLNCTIVENIAVIGGGVFHNPGGTLSVKNTIIALNLVDFTGTGPDVSGAFTSAGDNLIGEGTGGTGFTHGVNGDLVGTSAKPIDPKLSPLANNGGRTKTHALKAHSPAIDHGDNSGVPATDQRGAGFPRKKDGNGDGVAIVDIGAFER